VEQGWDLGWVADQTQRMIDWARAAPGQKGVRLDWEATWRNWMRRAAEERPKPNGTRPGQVTKAEHKLQLVRGSRP
jgi:hypothetical protein